MEKAVVNAILKNCLIANMVGHVTKKLDTTQVEVGRVEDLPWTYRLPEGGILMLL